METTKEGSKGTTNEKVLTVEGFLDRCAAGESSIRTYRKLFAKCETLLGKPLAAATVSDLAGLKHKLRAMPSGPSYIRRLKAFYKAAGRPDLAEICVLKQRLRRLSPDDLLTLPDINALLAAADSLRDRALLATLWATGQRVGAVCGLRLGDLREVPSENGGGAIRVFFRKVKVAGEEHVSFILDRDGGDHLRAWLKAYPFQRVPDAPLFPSYNYGGDVGGKGLTESGALKIVQATARRAKFAKRVYCHLFRHSRATHLLQLGMTEAEVKKLLGWHPASSVIGRYSHLRSEDSYNALLRASGLEVPERVDLGRLAAAEGDLQPVIAMMPSPGAASAASSSVLANLTPELLDGFLSSPKTQEAIVYALLQYLEGGSETTDDLPRLFREKLKNPVLKTNE